jgi:hypothetical protein
VRRTGLALALLALGYAAGTLAPHAAASDALSGVTRELAGIRSELYQLRRTLERAR